MSDKDYNAIKANNIAKVSEPSPKEEVKESRTPKQALVKATQEHKPGLVQRLVRATIGPEGMPKITKYIGKEVILPAVKDLVANALKTGVDMAFYRDGYPPTKYNGGWNQPRRAGYTNYSNNSSNAWQNRKPTGTNYNTRPIENLIDIPEYIIATRESAVNVLEQMRKDIDQFGQVTVADYYDYVGQPTSQYTDNVYGWADLHTARIIAVRGGYVISLPPADVL